MPSWRVCVLAAGVALGLPRAHAWGRLLWHCRTPEVFSPCHVPKALGTQHLRRNMECLLRSRDSRGCWTQGRTGLEGFHSSCSLREQNEVVGGGEQPRTKIPKQNSLGPMCQSTCSKRGSTFPGVNSSLLFWGQETSQGPSAGAEEEAVKAVGRRAILVAHCDDPRWDTGSAGVHGTWP